MLRTALIGAGGIGTHLARQIVGHDGATLAAVCETNAANRDGAGEEFDLPPSALFADEDAMYDSVDLDAVVVATPPAFHLDSVRAAFARDCHVLCEKPVVMDRAEAETLLDAVEATDLTLMSGYQRHLNPGFVHARERWQDGDVTPSFITGELTQDWTDHFEAGTNWRLDPDVGGRGHLFSVGTHVLESILWMTGLTPASVTAEMEFHDDGEHIDRQAALTVRFEEGAVASVGDSAVTPATREHIHVWDDEGAVYLDGEDWGRRELTVFNGGNEDVTPEIDYDAAPGKFEAFADAVETGTEPPATAGDAYRVTALLDAAYEAARTGERVEVDL